MSAERAVVIDRAIDELKFRGFVNVGALAIGADEVRELRTLADEIFARVPPGHPDHITAQTGAPGIMRLPQHDRRVAELLDRVVSNAGVRTLLSALLGPDYKLWQVNLRRSSPGDSGLYLHQDAPGETGLCILLTDNPHGDGATVFLPRSHTVPTRMKKSKVELPARMLMLLSWLFTPLKGRTGDVAFFFNRTWHGRCANRSPCQYDVIFMSFFPAGGRLTYEGYGNWSSEFLSEMRGTELGRLIDPAVGTERQSDGSYTVTAKDRNASRAPSYVLMLEDGGSADTRHPGDWRLAASVSLLWLLMTTGRPFVRFSRQVIGRLVPRK